MVSNTNDSGPGSLRAAIARAQPGDVITLNVPERFRWAAPSRAIKA